MFSCLSLDVIGQSGQNFPLEPTILCLTEAKKILRDDSLDPQVKMCERYFPTPVGRAVPEGYK